MTSTHKDATGRQQPISAGIIAALVGYTSSFAVVLTGLSAVGATPKQAASALLALCVTQGLGMIWLTRRYRLPLVLVWSTPGAALLAGTHTVDGGWPAVVGAFLFVGFAYVVTGLWPSLGQLIARIPAPIAQAMLAGVLIELCLAPVTALVDNPATIIPIALTWLIGVRLAPRWAVPAAFAVAGIAIGIDLIQRGEGLAVSSLVPALSITAPAWTWSAVVGIALPLYIVTMASQNLPGVAIMKSFGYEVPWRGSIVTAGAATLVGATVAGLALLGTLADALEGSVSQRKGREAAVVTFLVAASGVTALGIGSAFWAVVAGLVVHAVLDWRLRRPQPGLA